MDVEEVMKTFEPLLDIRGVIYMLLLSPSASSCTQEQIASITALIDDFHVLTETAGQHLRKISSN